jgi:hypothetical protein
MHENEHGIPDPEKIKEILDVVSEKVPGLLKELAGVLYGPDQAKKFGVAVATFYKELKDAGIAGPGHNHGPPNFVKKEIERHAKEE